MLHAPIDALSDTYRMPIRAGMRSSARCAGDDHRPRTRLTAALAERYRIEREPGAGGMATVSLAHDVKHVRLVAIEVLHAELAA